jgi:hypothetical protein
MPLPRIVIGIIYCCRNLLYLHVSFVYITANIKWEYYKNSLLFLDIRFVIQVSHAVSTQIFLSPSLSKIVEEKWVSVLSVVCGRNEWRQAFWKVRVISVELKCFASRQPVKCDANSRKQVAIVGCQGFERLCVCVCGDVTVGRLSLL